MSLDTSKITTAERAGFNLHRRDTLIWACAVLFLNRLFVVVAETPANSLEALLSNLAAVGIFQYMAWYAVFRLLVSSDPMAVPRRRDVLVAVAPCILLFLPTTRMIWGTASVVAISWWVFYWGDLRIRAAATVLASLSVQEFWGHIFFNFIAFPLLRAETAVVGMVLEAIRAGTVWQDNIITGPNGFGIAVYADCSAFHNLSLALLCWVTISKLRHPNWQIYDIAIGALVAITMVFLNVIRLCLMAWDVDLYVYWHYGFGAQIFAIGASLIILLISLFGPKLVER